MPSQESPLLTQLRNNIEFASVSQFLHTFQAALEPSRTAQRSSSQSGSRQATPLIEEGPFDTEVRAHKLLWVSPIGQQVTNSVILSSTLSKCLLTMANGTV